MNINTEINNIKQNNNSKHEAVISLFYKILHDPKLENKYDMFNKIYDTLILPEHSKTFIKRAINIVNIYPDYLDWIIPKLGSSLEDVYPLIKKIRSPTIIKKILNQFNNLTQEQFKEKLINPEYVNIHKDTSNPLTIYYYYLEKYNIDLLNDISNYALKIQENIIKKFIKNKHFDSSESYQNLKTYINKFPLKNQDEIYGYIFKFENNFKLFKIFEDKYINLLKQDCFDSNHIRLAIADRAKRDYIIDNYLQFPKVDSNEYLNRAIDCSLVLEGQTKKNTNEFSIFVNNLLEKHLSKEQPLNVEQFCIIFKRCHDFGFLDNLTTVFNELKVNDKDMYLQINSKLQNFPIIRINKFTKLDFSLPTIKKYIQELSFDYLQEILDEKQTKSKSKKI